MKELRKPLIKALIAVWALAGDSLSLLLSGYASEVPGAKYLFTVLEHLDGKGPEMLFMLFGTGAVFYMVRDRQKNPRISGLAVFFAVCTVIGISFDKTGSLDCIFLFGTQFLLALFVGVGYYFLYKNFMLFLQFVYDTRKEWFAAGLSDKDKLGVFLFDKHPFWGPFGFLVILGLPWLIAFCPGTLQWDAHGQLWMALGVTEQTGFHPVFISNYMAGCVKLGRLLFGSDSAGLFFYTFPQFLVQSFVFAYSLYTMKKWSGPVIFKWGALLFWGVFPYFQIWGFTMVKDTPYYIGFVLFMTVIMDVTADDGIVRDRAVSGKTMSDKRPDGKKGQKMPDRLPFRQYAMLFAGIVLMVYARNDGRYVMVLGLLTVCAAYRRYWKLWGAGLIVCVLLLFVEEGIYMPAQGIEKGPVGEVLSVPLQQTARYLRDHYDEVTEEEKEILQAGFDVDLTEIGSKYKGEISDPVKLHFVKNPDKAYLRSYFAVWFAQLKKHPDTYVQAFLNHVYGYFYPGYPNQGDYLIFSYIGNTDHWQDGTLDMQFAMKSGLLRDFLRHLVYVTESMPGLSLLYGCGVYTYTLVYAAALLCSKKRLRKLSVMVPGFVILLICLASPVNGYLRYMMPVMAICPTAAMWFWHVCREEDGKTLER